MRALLLPLLLSILTLFPISGNASDGPHQIAASTNEKIRLTNPSLEMYRSQFLDLSALVGRQNFAEMADALRHQIDIVESAGLSPRVLEFFRTIPISVNEMACSNPTAKDAKDFIHPACYSNVAPPEGLGSRNHGSAWDSKKSQWTNLDPVALAEDTGRGVILVRPILLDQKFVAEPVILHELLHAYHNRIMPQGFKNPGILFHYDFAKSGQLYPADAYLMTNEKEFFAVTASIFLYGKDGRFTRSELKEKQLDYYKYLVWLFGFDPDRAPRISPVASAR